MPKLTIAQYNTFKKFMTLTTSENDHEALVALRKANDVLQEQGVTWKQLLEKVVVLDQFAIAPVDNFDRDEEASPEQRKDFIDAAFRKAENQVNPASSFRDFIARLKDKWHREGHLSPREVQIVVDAGVPWAEKKGR